MKVFAEFDNRQLCDGELTNESNVESVGVYADGNNSMSVATELMTIIECLTIESFDVIHCLILLLDSESIAAIRAECLESDIEGDAHNIALKCLALLDRDEREKIATEILGQ
jgi:hypothetical protein